MIYGVAGYKRSGKTTAGKFLAAQYGFRRAAFADPIRNLVSTMDPWVIEGSGEIRRLSSLLEERGWEGIKADPFLHDEVRRLLQHAGHEWGRTIMDGTVWIVALEGHLDKYHKGWWRADGPHVVVDDVRYDNEARWVRLNHGKVIHVERPGLVIDDPHASEIGVDLALVHYHVLNLGTKQELHEQLRDVIEKEFVHVNA